MSDVEVPSKERITAEDVARYGSKENALAIAICKQLLENRKTTEIEVILSIDTQSLWGASFMEAAFPSGNIAVRMKEEGRRYLHTTLLREYVQRELELLDPNAAAKLQDTQGVAVVVAGTGGIEVYAA